MSKKCSRCKEVKPLKEFYFKDKLRGKLHSHCKSCLKAFDFKYRQSEEVRQKVRKINRELRFKLRRLIWEYLKEHPCIDCNEPDPIVLDFDHVTGEKDYTISQLVGRKRSWENILKEIEKCEVRCSNCHRRRHFTGSFIFRT